MLHSCPKSALKHLQLVQNATIRVLTRTKKCECISPVLKTPHWLPVKFKVDYKIMLLTLKGLAPEYLGELLISYCPRRYP